MSCHSNRINNFLYMTKIIQKYKKYNSQKERLKKRSLDSIASRVAKPQPQTVTKESKRNLFYKTRIIAGEIVGGRQCTCGRKIMQFRNINPDKTAKIMKSQDDKSYYSGLETCGSVWACPVCSLKISTHRALEVKNVINNVISGGGNVYMATFTVPHYIFNSLKDTTTIVTDVWRKIKTVRKFRELKEKYNFIGDIRTLEVTHGKNGWHPHLHILSCCNTSNENMEKFIAELFILWKKYVAEKNIGECSLNAFKMEKVYDGDGASEYITKWSAASELVKGNQKDGKSGRTPFQILNDIALESSESIEKDKSLFQEYARVFKGKRQLTWSKDFKKNYCDYDEKTDEEIAKEEQGGTLVLKIHQDVWSKIVNKHLESRILNVYDSSGVDGITPYLTSKGVLCHINNDNTLTLNKLESFVELSPEMSDFELN